MPKHSRREGKTEVTVKSFKEADVLLNEAFPDYQKVKGPGSNPASGLRKKHKLDTYNRGGAYHKDYAIDPKTGRVYGHEASPHGHLPHINIMRKDGVEVVIYTRNIMNLEEIIRRIESGQQLGKERLSKKGASEMWLSVGTQKWEGMYKVFIREIPETELPFGEFTRYVIKSFEKLNLAQTFLEESSSFKLEELRPFKGQLIFNPEFKDRG